MHFTIQTLDYLHVLNKADHRFKCWDFLHVKAKWKTKNMDIKTSWKWENRDESTIKQILYIKFKIYLHGKKKNKQKNYI